MLKLSAPLLQTHPSDALHGGQPVPRNGSRHVLDASPNPVTTSHRDPMQHGFGRSGKLEEAISTILSYVTRWNVVRNPRRYVHNPQGPIASVEHPAGCAVQMVLSGEETRDTSGGSGNEQNNSGSSGTILAGRNGNLLRRSDGCLREFSSNESGEQQQNHKDENDREDEEDEDHAPSTRKKKRLEERFNTSLVNFYEDLSAVPGPSGLKTFGIDRRSLLPAAASWPGIGTHSPRQHLQQPHSRNSNNNFCASTAPITEEQDPESEQANEIISTSIRQRKSI